MTCAIDIVYAAKKNGDLVQLPCEVCGEEKSEAHHDDYDKPLDVRWLCRLHHVGHHKKFGPGMNRKGKETFVQIRVSPDEKNRYKAAAASENLGLSEWIRKRCEGLTEPPVALQGHSGGRDGVVLAGREKPNGGGVGEMSSETREPVAATPSERGRSRPASTPSGLCSRTGFPVEACLCPQCKKLK